MSDSPAPDPKSNAPLGPTSTPAPVPPIQRSRWRKWGRRLLISLTILFVVLVVALLSARAYFRHTGQRDLRVELARLDAEDPGWRWDDLEAARQKAAPPEAQNGAIVVREVHAKIPIEWKEWRKAVNEATKSEGSQQPAPLNRQITIEDLIRDEDLADETRKAREAGLKLRHYPRGYHTVATSDLPMMETLPDLDRVRDVVSLMKVDATLAVQANDAVRALQATHAALNAGRSIGDEPILISSLVRTACGVSSVETVMRVLAHADSKTALSELAALQSAYLAEVEEPLILHGLRGECSQMSRFFEKVDSGQTTLEAPLGPQQPEPRFDQRLSFSLVYRGFLPGDHARYLRYMHGFIAAAKLPPQQQLAATARVEETIYSERGVRYRSPLAQLMVPAGGKVIESGLHHRSQLLSAATLIACERFRLTRGRWPESLAELPKDLLAAIPTDPYTGEPMKFARLPDGIAVYSSPPKDVRGVGKNRLTNPLGGDELGWRLYDPHLRGLPPLPKPKPEMPDLLDPDKP